MNAELVALTAFDLASPRLTGLLWIVSVSHSQHFRYKRFLMAASFCLSPPSLRSEWADGTQRMMIPLVLIRLFNYRVGMLFTETYTELTVEQRR